MANKISETQIDRKIPDDVSTAACESVKGLFESPQKFILLKKILVDLTLLFRSYAGLFPSQHICLI